MAYKKAAHCKNIFVRVTTCHWGGRYLVFEDKIIAYNSALVCLDRKSDALTITPLNHTMYNVLYSFAYERCRSDSANQ